MAGCYRVQQHLIQLNNIHPFIVKKEEKNYLNHHYTDDNNHSCMSQPYLWKKNSGMHYKYQISSVLKIIQAARNFLWKMTRKAVQLQIIKKE